MTDLTRAIDALASLGSCQAITYRFWAAHLGVTLAEIVDGTWFSVIAGSDRAYLSYPRVTSGPRIST